MRKMFFALLATLFTSYAAVAQVDKMANGDNKMSAQQRTERQVLRLEKELTLTGAQKEQVFVLLSKTNDQLDEIRKSAGSDKQGMRDKMKGVKAESDKGMQSILNADQYQQYLNLQEVRKQMHKGHHKGHGKPAAVAPTK